LLRFEVLGSTGFLESEESRSEVDCRLTKLCEESKSEARGKFVRPVKTRAWLIAGSTFIRDSTFDASCERFFAVMVSHRYVHPLPS
jgi:hypothetical protein